MSQISDTTKAMIARQAGIRRRRRGRVVACAGIALLTIAAAALIYWRARPAPPPPLDADPLVLARFAATDQFAGLSDERKWEYIDKMMGNMVQLIQAYNEKKITDQERDKAMENVGFLILRRRMEGYFQLEPGKARDAYIDKMIDEQEGTKFRLRLWPGSQPATRPATRPRPPGNNQDPAVMKKWIEKMPPDLRAQAAEFMRAMRDRREARGLPARPRGPF